MIKSFISKLSPSVTRKRRDYLGYSDISSTKQSQTSREILRRSRGVEIIVYCGLNKVLGFRFRPLILSTFAAILIASSILFLFKERVLTFALVSSRNQAADSAPKLGRSTVSFQSSSAGSFQASSAGTSKIRGRLTEESSFETSKLQFEEKRKALEEELESVKTYRLKLSQRLRFIDAVLDETKALDFNSFGRSLKNDSEFSSVKNKNNHIDNLPVGEGTEPDDAFSEFITVSNSNPASKILDSIQFRGRKYSKLRDNLIDAADYRIEVLRSIPIGAPVQGKVSSPYGVRLSPFSRRYSLHKGIDFAIHGRSPVIATAEGVVENAGWKGSYGRLVVINHGNGIKTRYGHLSFVSVKVGDRVCRGQQIGLVGSSGRSTGPHLHYELTYKSKNINPASFVQLASVIELLG